MYKIDKRGGGSKNRILGWTRKVKKVFQVNELYIFQLKKCLKLLNRLRLGIAVLWSAVPASRPIGEILPDGGLTAFHSRLLQTKYNFGGIKFLKTKKMDLNDQGPNFMNI